MLLTGEPGIGKTTLAREFVEHAATRGAAWAWGSCWDGGGAPAYWPWVQVGRTLARSADRATLRDRARRRRALDRRPAARAQRDARRARAGPPSWTPTRPASGSSTRSRRCCRPPPSSSRSSSSSTTCTGPTPRRCWRSSSSPARCPTCRCWRSPPTATPRRTRAPSSPRRSAASRAPATRLPLEGLGRDEVGQLAAVRARGLGGARARARSRRSSSTAVHHASAGNPFFVDELVQLLAAQGRLHDPRAAERPLPLPDGVRDAIRRRLPRSSRPSCEALGAAAVIGGEFRLQTLARVLDEPPTHRCSPGSSCRCAAASSSRGRDPGRFGFAHALVRDTLLESLGATRRARLHLVVAEALEEGYGDELEAHLAEIAHHFLQAGDARAAPSGRSTTRRAPRSAPSSSSPTRRPRGCTSARSTSPPRCPPTSRARGSSPRASARRACAPATSTGRCSALRAAAEHARRLDDPERLAQTALATHARRVLAGARRARARRDARGGARPPGRARRRRSRCRARRSTRCAAALRVQLALALYWSPHRERREQLVDEALGLARAIYSGEAARSSPEHRVLADRTLAFALAQGFVAVWGPDTVTRGLPISLEALELCERTNDAELGMQVRLWRISLLLELDDPVRADEEIEAFGSTARRLGQPRMLVYDPLHRAMAAHLRGDFAAAERFTAEAVEQSRDVPRLDRADHRRRPDVLRAAHAGPPGRARAARAPQRRPPAGDAPLALRPGARARRARPRGRGAPRARASRGRRLRGRAARRALARLDGAARRAVRAARRPPARAAPVRAADRLRGPQRRLDGRRLPRPGRALPRPAGDDDRRGRARAGPPRDRALGGRADGRAADRRAGGARRRRGARAPCARRATRSAAGRSCSAWPARPRSSAWTAPSRAPTRCWRAWRRRRGRPGGPAGRRRGARRCAASRTSGCWSTTGAASACTTPRGCTTSRRCSSARARRSPRSRSPARSTDAPRAQAAALVAYRAQARELREELAEARAFNDPERISRARERLELIAADVEQRRRGDERGERARADQRHAGDQGRGAPDRRAGARPRSPPARHRAHRHRLPLRARPRRRR